MKTTNSLTPQLTQLEILKCAQPRIIASGGGKGKERLGREDDVGVLARRNISRSLLVYLLSLPLYCKMLLRGRNQYSKILKPKLVIICIGKIGMLHASPLSLPPTQGPLMNAHTHLYIFDLRAA